MPYPRLHQLIADLEPSGYALSENLMRTIQIGHDHAAQHNLRPATDVLLYGLLRSNNTVASLIAELTDEPGQFITRVSEALTRYRARSFPPELTYHCSRGAPLHVKKDGYKDPHIGDSNAPVYATMVKIAESEKRTTVENRHLFTALLTPQPIRHSAVVPGITRREERPTLASDLLIDLRISANQLSDLVRKVEDIENAHESQKYLIFYDGTQFRFRPFDLINGYKIVEIGESQLLVAKANLVDQSSLLWREDVEEFEWLINKADISESELQKFFERHPAFLLGVEYKHLHSQLTLHPEESHVSSLRPDFFLERITSNFCDIVDLKRPNERLVIRTRNRTHFSAALTEAMAQLREYRDYFDNPRNRGEFERAYGIRAFRPRISVIVGRRSGYYDEMERVKLESDLSHLRVLTYDDIIDQARRRLMLNSLG